MRRRQFLGLMAALAAAGAAAPAAIRPARAADPLRLGRWRPAANPSAPASYVALEWRYLAGRITTASEDFGFVISLADYNPLDLRPLPSPINWNYQELLVMRQDFTGAGAHVTRTYRGGIAGGGLAYDEASATYSFVADDDPAVTATWHFDEQAGAYSLSVATPELTLNNLLLTPVGQLIQEGGAATISSGELVVNGVPVTVSSEYYADWVALSEGGEPLGYARLDMQTLKPALGEGGGGSGDTDFSHHWFCLACTLEDDTPAWVSAWQIVSGDQPAWGVTIATGREAGWSVRSVTEQSFSGVQPLALQILEWQPVPATTPARRTGKRWRLFHGVSALGDALNLELSVPEGQFVQGARISTLTEIAMQESAGVTASGTIGGRAIKSVAFVMAESTHTELEPTGLPRRAFLPSVTR